MTQRAGEAGLGDMESGQQAIDPALAHLLRSQDLLRDRREGMISLRRQISTMVRSLL